ncbi:MAG: translation elongation factor Ts [Phycisphaerae bacterium]
MAQITSEMVKALREKTGLPMMACKKALEKANGDPQAASDILRKEMGAAAEKKSGRATGEGLIGIAQSPDRTSAAMVEVRCETDFCARNDVFGAMVAELAGMALNAGDGKVEATPAITAAVQSALQKIGENMSYARGIRISAPRIGAYLHHNKKVGVLIGVEGEVTDEVLSDLCMHVAFADPMGIVVEDIPADIVEKEKQIAKEQAIASGKPADIAEKMVAGKIRKFLEERALVEQLIAREDKYGKKKVKDILGKAKVKAFARFAVGG